MDRSRWLPDQGEPTADHGDDNEVNSASLLSTDHDYDDYYVLDTTTRT